MKVYLTTFLVFGIPFGLIIGGFKGATAGIEGGLILGLVTSLLLGTLHKIMTRKMAAGGDVGPRQSKTVILDMPYDDAFDRCCDSLNQFGATIRSFGREHGLIKAKTRSTWKSHGEIILVELSNQGTGQVSVQVSSSPRLRTTLFDFGKGYENVERITGLLTATDLVNQNAGGHLESPGD